MAYFIYDLIYTSLCALTALFEYCGLIGMEKPSVLMLITLLIPCLCLPLYTHLKLRGKILFTGIALAGMIGIFYMVIKTDILSGTDVTLLLATVAVAFISFILSVLMTRFSAVRIAVCTALIISLILSLIGYFSLPKPGIFFSFLLILFSLANGTEINWIREGFTDARKHMITVFPFLAVLVLCASLIKYPSKPYDWNAFVKMINKAEDVFGYISYGFHSTTDAKIGFSENAKLLSNAEESMKPVLKLTTKYDINTPVYLYGNSFDTFDGKEWKNKNKAGTSERGLDTAETLAGLYSCDLSITDYLKKTNITLEYLDTKSRYLFTPAKSTSVVPEKNIGISERSGAYRFKKYNTFHFKTSEGFYLLNTDNPAFYNYMRSESPITGYDWKNATDHLKDLPDKDGLSFEDYEKYINHVNDTYNEDIVLSDEMKALLDEIIQGSESDYDKLKKLEAYLQQLDYSLDTSPLPNDVRDPSSYLDHFMLNERSGFCIHYATAFTLLARSMGLPARYVQGYRIYVGTAGSYTLTSNMTHAWPEVYFEGKGWIPFEPTPGFGVVSYWQTREEADAARMPYVPQKTPTADEPLPSDDDAEASEKEMIAISPYIVLIPLLSMAVFFILFILINKALQKHRFSSLDDRSKYLFVSKECLKLCTYMGLKIAEGETLSEFSDRIEIKTGDKALGFIPGYETLLYSDHPDPVVNPDDAIRSHGLLLNILKETQKYRYPVYILFNISSF